MLEPDEVVILERAIREVYPTFGHSSDEIATNPAAQDDFYVAVTYLIRDEFLPSSEDVVKHLMRMRKGSRLPRMVKK